MKLSEIKKVPKGKILVKLTDDEYEIMTHEQLKDHLGHNHPLFATPSFPEKITRLPEGEHKEVLHIYPDYGFGPYIWHNGSNMIDAVCGWKYTHYPVSDSLHKKFARWVRKFERNVEPGYDDKFDWISFHKSGLKLAKELHEEIGHLAVIVYVKAYEDPNHEENRSTVITHSLSKK